ncbi:type II toxin-antitoxin system VapC family toxin [Chelatococcus asaccharovorans]|uniref:type II toxin-antitoxin system VapC family toxin n=1 Tax=Chelatococcus asaccharovorans TaxID=28210 RepID=UPI00224C764B|nr:type II toxin-antitoxin system VapC family toxin [Chelatococcus asaccharovorans]CAH1666971.1 Ribonuclease VapC [Chelatococcus asaccharovorans]CAH1681223.1 Ribonuclease VapC [Chelatococcus asaccharovorans]HMR30107.1 type II toxin-antitoxin system VapC family toxin [Geminicoccus sp.]HMU50525.1 type II toxin-antitoxin system VapC family toxin [Geminicoccaceae bacterium]
MTVWMLDTNIASHIIKGDRPEITDRLTALPMSDIVISSVTEGELRYGLAKRGYPKALSERVRQFLLRVDVLPWDHDVTQSYGELRAGCEARGVTLAPLDMMIAAHAVAADAILVTRDKAFARVSAPLKTDDWGNAGS